MKKIIAILVVLVLAFFGGSFYLSSQTQKYFDRYLGIISKTDGVSIERNSFDKGLFSSKDELELKISKKIVAQSLGTEESLGFSDILLLVKSDIKHSLFSGVESKSKVEIIGENEKFIKKFFGSNHIADIISSKALIGDIKTQINIKDIDFKEDENTLKSKNVRLTFLSDDENNLANMGIGLDELSFSEYRNHIKIEHIKYLYKPIKALDVKSFFTKLVEGSCNFSIDKISLEDGRAKANISKFSSSSTFMQEKNAEFLSNKNMINIEKIYGDEISFKDINLDFRIHHLHVKSVNEFLAYIRESDPSLASLEQIGRLGEKILSYKPTLFLQDLSLKNDKDKKARLHFQASAKEVSLDGLSLKGQLSLDTTLSEFFYQAQGFKSILDGGQDTFFTNKNGKYILDFRYDKDKKDIIINDTLTLFDMTD